LYLEDKINYYKRVEECVEESWIDWFFILFYHSLFALLLGLLDLWSVYLVFFCDFSLAPNI
jgi:hypothetical protein